MKSQSSTWIAILVIIGVVGVSAYRMLGRPGSTLVAQRENATRAGAFPDPGRSPPDSNESLRRQVAQLQLQVAALSAQLGALKPASSAEGAEPAAPPTAPLTVEQQVEHDRVAWEEHMTAVEADFQAETRDGHWAQSAAAMLQDRAAADGVMRGAVKQIECRSTICRVEMVDDQKGPFGRQLPVFLQSLGGTFPTAQASTSNNPDGTKTLNVYFSTTAGAEAPGSLGG